jgi:hypothetical protein
MPLRPPQILHKVLEKKSLPVPHRRPQIPQRQYMKTLIPTVRSTLRTEGQTHIGASRSLITKVT